MIKNKNIPKLRIPEFKEEGEWEKKRLEDFCQFFLGLTYTPQYVSSGIPFLSVKDITNGYISFNNTKYISKEEFNSSTSNAKPQKGDILFGRVGTLGQPIVVDFDVDFCIFVSLGFIRLGNDVFNYFLKYWMESLFFENQIRRQIAGSSQKNLNVGWLKKFKINLPSLPEQTKIADFLSAVDKRIDLLSNKVSQLEEYKKGAMQKLFSQEVRFKEDNGEEFPEWEKKRLGDLLIKSHIKVGKNSSQYEIVSSTTRGLFNQKDYFNHQVASKNLSNYKIITKGNLVFSPQNLWLGNININEDFDQGIVSPSYKVFKINPVNSTSKYIKYIIKLPYMMCEYDSCSEAGASIVRRNLNLDLFFNIKCNLPSLPEQTKIANFLSSLDTKIELATKELNKTEEYKKGLLQQMFI